MSKFRLELSYKAQKDLENLEEHISEYNINKKIEKINIDIQNLTYMPRIHKTLYSFKDPKGEYRRIVSGKYIIIYKILNNQITILRVFSEKQNYLNLNDFILKEKSTKYIIKKYHPPFYNYRILLHKDNYLYRFQLFLFFQH